MDDIRKMERSKTKTESEKVKEKEEEPRERPGVKEKGEGEGKGRRGVESGERDGLWVRGKEASQHRPDTVCAGLGVRIVTGIACKKPRLSGKYMCRLNRRPPPPRPATTIARRCGNRRWLSRFQVRQTVVVVSESGPS